MQLLVSYSFCGAAAAAAGERAVSNWRQLHGKELLRQIQLQQSFLRPFYIRKMMSRL